MLHNVEKSLAPCRRQSVVVQFRLKNFERTVPVEITVYAGCGCRIYEIIAIGVHGIKLFHQVLLLPEMILLMICLGKVKFGIRDDLSIDLTLSPCRLTVPRFYSQFSLLLVVKKYD